MAKLLDVIDKREPYLIEQMRQALPSNLDPRRLLRIARSEIAANPKLQATDPSSFLNALIRAASLGLEPGLLQQCYLVPYGDQVQLIIGYRGMMDLVRRSGEIKRFAAHVVYAEDEFSYSLGLEESLLHKPALGERGDPTHVYAFAEFNAGGYQYEVLSIGEVEAIRARSKARGGPWQTDYARMAQKTALKRLTTYLPLSVDAMEAVAIDNSYEAGSSLPNIIDIPAEPVDKHAGAKKILKRTKEKENV